MSNNSFSEKELVKKCKHLAFLLRHDADAFNKGLMKSDTFKKHQTVEYYINKQLFKAFPYDVWATIIHQESRKRLI